MIYLYEHLMFYSSVAMGEYSKVGGIINLTLLLITALGVREYKPTKWMIGMFVIGAFVLSVVIGITLVNLHVPQIANSLGNQQNLQIEQILQTQQQILTKLSH